MASLLLSATLLTTLFTIGINSELKASEGSHGLITLPEPKPAGRMTVEEALRARRSTRTYTDEALELNEIAQLLWAAQGITDKQGLRTAPSAGALYPLELYLVVGKVSRLNQGTYHYLSHRHQLKLMAKGDKRTELAHAAFGQTCVSEAAAIVVFSAIYERTQRKYGKRAIRFVHMEVGHAAQNVFLQATSLGLGTVTVGAFNDKRLHDILALPEQHRPLYLMPVGR